MGISYWSSDVGSSDLEYRTRRRNRKGRGIINPLLQAENKNRPHPKQDAGGLGGVGEGVGRGERPGPTGRRRPLGCLHLRIDDRNAVRDRREAVVRQLDDEFAGLRGLRDGGVERLLAVFGIELEEFGRRLDGGIALQRGGRVLEALAGEGDAFLAGRFEVLLGDLRLAGRGVGKEGGSTCRVGGRRSPKKK